MSRGEREAGSWALSPDPGLRCHLAEVEVLQLPCPRGGCISAPGEPYPGSVIRGCSPAALPQRWLHLSAWRAIPWQRYTWLFSSCPAPEVAASQRLASHTLAALYVAVLQLPCPRGGCISAPGEPYPGSVIRGCSPAALPQRWLHLSAWRAIPWQRYTWLFSSCPAPEVAASQRLASHTLAALYVAVLQLPCPRGGCISAPGEPYPGSVIRGCSPAALPQRWLHLSAWRAIPWQRYTWLFSSCPAPEVAASQRLASHTLAALYVAVLQLLYPRGGCISVSGKHSLCNITYGCVPAAPLPYLHAV
nr:uncharacterized protein LOC112547063 [Pelodiscus sinensis]XP_025044320.1 uncharacterized protein LOC112547063 [Pelodiscus sinensis]|eukprot:XP_025044319.1 uncharacterized protein LOC112547063 [Pelodiscus sinensis]